MPHSTEQELDSLREQLLELEQQHAHLMCLYVACSRLHASPDREDVLAAIHEIVINLIGCEELAVFEKHGERLSLISSFGIDPAPYQDEAWDRRRPAGGPGGSFENATAVVPLILDGRETGAIVLFRLLDHKPALEPIDHELFELLTTHAATALHATAPCTV
jgi:K+-sensing histidine kinase KdpD